MNGGREGTEKSRQADRDKLKGREEFLDCSNLLVQVRYLQPADRRGFESPPHWLLFIGVATTFSTTSTLLQQQLCQHYRLIEKSLRGRAHFITMPHIRNVNQYSMMKYFNIISGRKQKLFISAAGTTFCKSREMLEEQNI